MICAGLLGMLFCCLPGAAIGVFIEPWSKEFGWSLTSIGSSTIFLGLGAALTSPWMGRLMDRFGARRVLLAYIPLLSISVAATSFIGAGLSVLFVVMFLHGCIATGLGAYTRAIATAFDSSRGTAMGTICVGVGLSEAIAPRLAQWVVDDYGWVAGNHLLASLVLLAWPLAYVWLPESKERIGDSLHYRVQPGYTRREAVRTKVFRLLACSFFLWGFTGGGTVFLMPFLTSHGMSRAAAASCIGTLGLTTVLGLPLFGLLIDRLHAPFVAATALLVSASAFIMLGVSGIEYAMVAVPMIGIAGSAWMSCLDYCTTRYFGLKAFSEVSGLIDRMACLGGMIGPFAFSVLRDATGNYSVPYFAAGLLAIASATCIALVGRRPFPKSFQ